MGSTLYEVRMKHFLRTSKLDRTGSRTSRRYHLHVNGEKTTATSLFEAGRERVLFSYPSGDDLSRAIFIPSPRSLSDSSASQEISVIRSWALLGRHIRK
jgi:hypothetical protein